MPVALRPLTRSFRVPTEVSDARAWALAAALHLLACGAPKTTDSSSTSPGSAPAPGSTTTSVGSGCPPGSATGVSACRVEGSTLECGWDNPHDKTVCEVDADGCLVWVQRDCVNDDCRQDPDCVLPECAGLTFDVQWQDDGLVPTDSDGDGVPDVGCGDQLLLVPDCPGDWIWDTTWGGFWFHYYVLGVVDTGGAVPWSGEDCLSGAGPSCHEVFLSTYTTDGLVEVCDPSSVVLGESTMFDASRAADLTWLLADAAHCYTWGHDPAYYAALGCDPAPLTAP